MRGLNAPPRKNFTPDLGHNLGDLKRLFERFYGARPRDDRRLKPAYVRVANPNDRVFTLQVAADQLIRLRNSYGLGHSREVFEMSWIDRALIARDADCGPSRAGHGVRLEAELADNL